MLPSGLPEVPSDSEATDAVIAPARKRCRAAAPRARRVVGSGSPGLPPIPEESAPESGASSAGRSASVPGHSASAPGHSASAPGQRSHQVEHVHRGSHKDGEGAVPPALQEVLRNLRSALEQPLDVRHAMQYLSSRRPKQRVTVSMLLDHILCLRQDPRVRHVSRAEDVLACVTGMSARTLQAVFQGLRARHGHAKDCGGAGGRPSGRDSESSPVEHGGGDSVLPNSEILDDLDAHDVGRHDLGCSRPSDDATSETQSTPGQHHVHDARSVGLRLGALVARLYAEPRLPASAFTPLVSFMDAQSPGCVGELNHGTDFFKGLGRCMVQHLQQCIALEHWAQVPALGIPSDYARIIDGYTCEGEPCQVIVHIVTTPGGALDWLLVDVAPNAAAPDMHSDEWHQEFGARERDTTCPDSACHESGLIVLASLRSQDRTASCVMQVGLARQDRLDESVFLARAESELVRG